MERPAWPACATARRKRPAEPGPAGTKLAYGQTREEEEIEGRAGGVGHRR